MREQICPSEGPNWKWACNKVKYGSGSEQGTEFADLGENGNIQPTNLWAESGSFGPIEDISEDFSKMIGVRI